MISPRRFATTLTTTIALAGLALPRGASAQQVVAADCNLDFKDVYNKGDAVCVTGDLDYVPPSKIFAEAYIYVIPVDHPNPFADITGPMNKGAPNYIVATLGGGGFIDEYVWLPELRAGQYEFVIDNHPFYLDDNAPFDPGKDLRTGYAFSVSNAPTVWSVDTKMIKAQAALALDDAKAIETLADALELIDKLSDIAELFLGVNPAAAIKILLGEICDALMVECPTSYNGWVISTGAGILRELSKSLQKKYLTLIADPPDPNFKAVIGVDFADLTMIGHPWTPAADVASSRSLTAIANQIGLQAAAYTALVPSMEKAQGALQAGDNLWALLHAEKVKAYAQMAIDAGDTMSAEADALEALYEGGGVLDVGTTIATYNGWIEEIKAHGLSEDNRNVLRSYGFTEQQIDGAAASFAAKTPLVDDPNMKNVLKRVRGTFAQMKPALQDLVSQAEKVRAENEAVALRPGPRLTLAAPPAGAVGVPMMLTATADHFDPMATLTYAWDLDLDGQYDDGDKAAVSYTPTAPGTQVVAVRVSDGKNVDLGHMLVETTISNAPPQIAAATPIDSAPFADVGEAVALHVDVEDKDGDPTTIAWTVDGAPAGMGPDLMFTMPDDQAHWVRAVVSDDDPYSPDAQITKVIRAKKWESMIEDTTGDASSGGSTDSNGTGSATEGGSGSGGGTSPTGGEPTGGGGGGSSGSGGSGASASGGATGGSGSESGCACQSGAPQGGAGLLLLTLLALPRRRARRVAGL